MILYVQVQYHRVSDSLKRNQSTRCILSRLYLQVQYSRVSDRLRGNLLTISRPPLSFPGDFKGFQRPQELIQVLIVLHNQNKRNSQLSYDVIKNTDAYLPHSD